ncbi:GNAT family N-acetyltransferase [Gemella cuniculi]|uniref:GNAT family N-acetyltransferase n=1 Tax=Gemella cuniculi TaxID=150240 RepID=UPI00041F3399|nr:GNAT family N-acetyltransferase [Gemella cuniculi]
MFKVRNKVLETERLILRGFRKTDLEDFYEYAKVDGVGEAAGWEHHNNIQETSKILEIFLEEDTTFAIYHKIDNKVIGSVGVESVKKDIYQEYITKKGYELGYVLSKEYWGQGLMTEAINELITYLFDVQKVDYLSCGYFKNNKKSKRVNEKCGFKKYKEVEYKLRNEKSSMTVFTILEK